VRRGRQGRSLDSTPADLIRLGEAAMAIPTFRQMVALGQVTLPRAGLVYNLDYDLGQDDIIGLKTGSDSAANGCFLFAAQKTVGGKNVTLIGAVLGQEGTSPNTAAVNEADLLVKAAFASIALLPLFPAGHVVGQLVTPGGASAPVHRSRACGLSRRPPTGRAVRGRPGHPVRERVGWHRDPGRCGEGSATDR
jgi:D-alanyl-D-alanine carboxypeptidase (penicillin-binding protein 5/6)